MQFAQTNEVGPVERLNKAVLQDRLSSVYVKRIFTTWPYLVDKKGNIEYTSVFIVFAHDRRKIQYS